MNRPLLRVHLLLPRRGEVEGLSFSLVGHLALATVIVLVGTGWSGTTDLVPSRGVMSVDLVARPSPAERRAPEPKTPVAEPDKVEPPKPKPKPVTKRVEADAPMNVEDELSGTTAQPEELPVADEPTPDPAPPPESLEADDAGGAESGESIAGTEPIEGGVGGGIETDEPFDADYYVNVVVLKLRNAWRDRPVLPHGAPPKRTVISFRIQRDGTVTAPRVAVPSGLRLLDESALRAVVSVGRFPPLPRYYDGDSLGARFVFELLPPD